MSKPTYIDSTQIEHLLSWPNMMDALIDGHKYPPAQINDQIIEESGRHLLTRSAWIDGLGACTKTVTISPDNNKRKPTLPTVQGVCVLFEEGTGALSAILDSSLITYWKTAADSVLGATILAPPTPSSLVIIGAGSVAKSLIDAYTSIFPSITDIAIATRTPNSGQLLVGEYNAHKANIYTSEISEAVIRSADILCCSTSSHNPVFKGEWLSPGTHVDLIGAYAGNMREADDETLKRGRLYVDSRETTIAHIGEILIPLSDGVITEQSVLGDLYDLTKISPPRREQNDITIFKNGGGAHLDLMIANAMHGIWLRHQS